MQQIRRTAAGSLDGEYRVGNVLTDPVDPTVTVFRPDGTEFATATPTKLITGVYRYTVTLPTNEPLGVWQVVWGGTLNGLPVSSIDVFQLIGANENIDTPTVDELRIGIAGSLDGEYRVGNVLTDPVDPTVTVFRPDGTEFATATPTKLITGVYRYTVTLPTNEPLGVWQVVWGGTLNGLPVSSPATFDVINPGLHAIDQIQLGFISAIDGKFRVGNDLVDPTNPLVTILRPDGTEFGAATPSRLYTGVYRYSFIIPATEAIGIWSAVWTGLVDGVIATSTDIFETVETAEEVTHAPLIDQIRIAMPGALSGQFRIGNTLVDPATPAVKLFRPDGSEFAGAQPLRLQEGVYIYTFSIPATEPLGIWKVRWDGVVSGQSLATEDAFEVIAREAANLAPSIDQIHLGEIGNLDAQFRAGNVLTNPLTPTITVYRPDGTEYANAIPFQIYQGVYRFSLLLPTAEPTGYWSVRWAGVIDGQSVAVVNVFEVSAVQAVSDLFIFDTSISGLQAYIPALPITLDSLPSKAHCVQYLDEIGSEVSLRIGDVQTSLSDRPGVLSRVLRFARHVTYLGAAALAQDATNPERSEIGGDGYASVTWDRYQKALDKLEAIVDAATPGDTPGAGDDLNFPEIESAPPMFTSNMPF